jgi:hypothetical protein
MKKNCILVAVLFVLAVTLPRTIHADQSLEWSVKQGMDSVTSADLAAANKCVCDRLGISFSYPKGWLAKQRCDSRDTSSDSIYLKPPRWLGKRDPELELEDYPVSVRLVDEGFADALYEASFEKVNGIWFTSGRFGQRGDVERIAGTNWVGMAGEQTIGILDKANGGEANATVLVAVLNYSKTRSAIVTSGPATENAAFYLILRSIKFLAVHNKEKKVG